MRWVEFVYYTKKAYALYPGIVTPHSAPVFAEHYAWRKTGRSPVRAMLDAVVGVLFHAWIPWRARVIQRRFGKDDDWRRRSERIAHERFVDPSDIALFRIEQAQELDGYIRRFEDAAFNKIINPLGWTRHCALVDKRRFYGRCAEHGIRHPAVHAIIEGDRLRDFCAPAGSPLVIKPAHGEGGRGVARLPAPLSAIAEPVAFLAALRPYLSPREDAWVVQEAVDNHAALAAYAMDALVTARITSLRDEHGRPEVVNAVLRMPSRRGPIIDNMKAGGLILPVDVRSGRVGMACQGYGGRDFTHHPVSGAALDALCLPHWTLACQMAITAHEQAFGDYTLIGWDVAFAPDGPMLIEGNAKPGVLMPQRSGRRGLAGQRYGELLAWHLARRGRDAFNGACGEREIKA